MTLRASTPQLGLGNKEGRLLEILRGQPTRARAFLETIDSLIEDMDEPHADEIEDMGFAIERCLLLDVFASRRMLESTIPEMVAMDFADAWMPGPVVRRLLTLGINPLGVALLGQMEMCGITILDGPHLGTVVECETARHQTDRHEISPSFVAGMLIWDSLDNDITLLNTSFPETAAVQMEGRRLEEVASSPLTDGMGLVIGRVSLRDDIEATTIILQEPRMIRLRDVPDLMSEPPADWSSVGTVLI